MLKILLITFFSGVVFYTGANSFFPGKEDGIAKDDAHEMFNNKILPVIQTKCAPCHVPDKGGFKAQLDNFDSAAKRIDECLVRVQLPQDDPKYMPFRNKRPALADSELVAFKAWGALVNKK